MPGKAEIEAGRAFVRLFLKDDFSNKLSGVLNAAGGQLRSFGKTVGIAGAALSAAGGAILTPLIGAVKSFAGQGDELDKMSQRTGIAGSALAELSFAAEQSGASLSDVEAGVRRMQRSILDLSQGTQTAKDAFRQLGLNLSNLSGLSPEDQFQLIADRVALIEDPTRRAAVAMEVFGRGGTAILPMLGSLGELRQEARDLGIIPAQEEIENAAKVTDAINRVKRVLKAMVFNIGANLAEDALKFLDVAKRIGIAVKDWVTAHGNLLRSAAAIGAVLVVAGAAVTALGTAIFGAGVVLSTLATIVGAILSPLGLVIGAVVAATVAFFQWTESGQAAYKSLTANFGNLLTWFREVFGAISAAMSAGDMQLAAEIMWAGIKVAWIKGVAWVQGQWAELRFFLVDTWGKAAFAVLDTLNYLWAGMVDGFWSVADKVVDAWKFVERSFAKGIAWVLAKLQGLDPNEVMANVDQDYDRQQAGRDSGRAARDAANREAADARFAANEAARREWASGAASKRDVELSSADAELQKARAALAKAAGKAKSLTPADVVTAGDALDGVETPQFGIPKMGAEGKGVQLTATYSASAARISGYQPGGRPEEKMASGIAAIDANTKEQAEKMKELVSETQEAKLLYQRFLAGWSVT